MKRFHKLSISLFLILSLAFSNLIAIPGVITDAYASTAQISAKNLFLKPGQTKTLKITGTTEKATWTSSDTSVATVSKNGKVTAKGYGEAQIKAKASGYLRSCKVYVVDKSKLILPITDNKSDKVLIQTVSGSTVYPLTSYIISSIDGENVVLDPTSMPLKELIDLDPAAITNTHTHSDHIDAIFSDSYDCPKLSYVEGVLDTKDFHIYSIISSHNGDTLSAYAQNVMIVYEVDGLRIAQMGDIGQTKLTDDQLKKLGKIDIAIMQFDNSYSSMSLKNEKGFNLMEQLKPKAIITMNDSKEALEALEDHYGDVIEVENALEISKDDLPSKGCQVYHISNTHKYMN